MQIKQLNKNINEPDGTRVFYRGARLKVIIDEEGAVNVQEIVCNISTTTIDDYNELCAVHGDMIFAEDLQDVDSELNDLSCIFNAQKEIIFTERETESLSYASNVQRNRLIDSLREHFTDGEKDDVDWLCHEINEMNIIIGKIENKKIQPPAFTRTEFKTFRSIFSENHLSNISEKEKIQAGIESFGEDKY